MVKRLLIGIFKGVDDFGFLVEMEEKPLFLKFYDVIYSNFGLFEKEMNFKIQKNRIPYTIEKRFRFSKSSLSSQTNQQAQVS